DLAANVSLDIRSPGRVVLSATQHLASLTIASGARATLSAGGSRSLVTQSLQVAGVLDLTNNTLIVQANSTNRRNVLATVEGYITTAYNSTPTHWQGNGITSSSAAANLSRALGVILNSENGLRYTNYNGESVDDNSIIVTHTLVGDLNLDRAVTIADFITLAGRFGNAGDWGVGDTNYDGQVTISDFLD